VFGIQAGPSEGIPFVIVCVVPTAFRANAVEVARPRNDKRQSGADPFSASPYNDGREPSLELKDYARWLGEEPAEPPHLMAMLRPYPAEAMEAYGVSARVGNVKNTGAALFEPLASGALSAEYAE